LVSENKQYQEEALETDKNCSEMMEIVKDKDG
jgi:hypothetical protein